MKNNTPKLFRTSDYHYQMQMNLFLRLAAELGFVVYKPDYHGKAGDKGTVLFYTKDDHRHNCEVDKQLFHYSSADDARLHHCTDERYYYRPFFYSFENTDRNGLFSYSYANFGKVDLSSNYDALEKEIRVAFAKKMGITPDTEDATVKQCTKAAATNEKVIHDCCALGTDALDALEARYGFAHGIDDRDYILMEIPKHTEYLPEKIVGALGIPVLKNANIPQGEPVMLLWLDMFCADATELCQAVVLPIHQKINAEVVKTLRKLMWPKDIDADKLAIRRTEIQAILENKLYEDEKAEQMLVNEAEHIDVLLGNNG